MREELKGRNLSFTEIAKLVGENWQNLAPAEKEPYEQQAFSAKERYNNELAEYKKTNNYKEYAQYLADFKARQSNQHQGTPCTMLVIFRVKPANNFHSAADSDAAKRPKLEAHVSTTSSGTGSSAASVARWGDFHRASTSRIPAHLPAIGTETGGVRRHNLRMRRSYPSPLEAPRGRTRPTRHRRQCFLATAIRFTGTPATCSSMVGHFARRWLGLPPTA
jgi:hypothetical protein